MVFASIYGSSASNGYGSGGSVNATCFSSGFATGFSSDCEFDLGFLVSASNRPGTAPLTPMTAAPKMPVPAMNLRRLMTASSTLKRVRKRVDYTAIPRRKVSPAPYCTKNKVVGESPFAFHWMRESAQRADSAMTWSCEAQRRVSNSLTRSCAGVPE